METPCRDFRICTPKRFRCWNQVYLCKGYEEGSSLKGPCVMDYQTVWDLQHDLFQQTIDAKIHNRRTQTKTPPQTIFCWLSTTPLSPWARAVRQIISSQARRSWKPKEFHFLKSIEVGILPIMALVKSLAIHSWSGSFFYRYPQVFAFVGASHYRHPSRFWNHSNTESRRDWRLVRCQHALCEKDMRHGHSGKPLGYHAWVFFECQHQPL